MNEGYQKYLDAVKKVNPIGFKNREYMSLNQYKEAVGIVDEEEVHIPLQIRPRSNARKVDATHKNYEVTQCV